MSKRTRKSTQKSLSQPTPERQRASQVYENEKEKDLTEEINKCVLSILLKSGSDNLIRKADLQKAIFTTGGGRQFDTVLEAAKRILLKVYGLRVELCEENRGTRVYTVFNALPYKKLTENGLNTDKKTKILDFLVLTHVFMSENNCPESSLVGFLKSLKIDVDKIHTVYHNIRDHINISMVRRKYLEMSTDTGTGKVTYSWGPRAECTIMKEEVLNFVAMMYNCPPTTWKKQYEAAKLQTATNKRPDNSEEENNVEEMDTD